MSLKINAFSYRSVKTVRLPASKSILNRALLLCALGDRKTKILFDEISEDSSIFLECLKNLGVSYSAREDGIEIQGCRGKFAKCACLNVGDCGTAARFLTTAVGICGGDVRFTASLQMSRRPMGLLSLLEQKGCKVIFENRPTFPFRLISSGISDRHFSVDTEESTQYASALALSSFLAAPIEIRLTGRRKESGYLNLTQDIMRKFSIPTERKDDMLKILPQGISPDHFQVEADLSCAAYFCALALLCKAKFLLRGASLKSLQPDRDFLLLLRELGVSYTQTEEGLIVEGTKDSFQGFDVDFSNFSDQVLTAAALAPFATTPSKIRNISHIRRQESDRLQTAILNLNALGIPCSATKTDLSIFPAPIRSSREEILIHTFGDHRAAMAFALIGCRTGNIILDHADCCKKSFPNFYNYLNTELI